MKKMKQILIENYKQILDEDSNGDDEMSPDELKQELIEWAKELQRNTNEWATRDKLLKLTAFDWWDGEEYAQIDIDTADDIASKLLHYVEDLSPDSFEFDEMYDIIYGS